MMQDKYKRSELFGTGVQRVYSGKYLNEISFPVGGIGAGCIGLSGRGGLRDFEIFNRPNVGSEFPRTFPLLRVRVDGGEPESRVLMGPLGRPYTPLDGGRYKANAEGFPHMDSCTFRGEYPFAWIAFKTEVFPVSVELEAYNPFIPGEPDASGMPIMVLKYKVENLSDVSMECSILWSLWNIVGFLPEDCLKNMVNGFHEPEGDFCNMVMDDGDVKGVLFGNFKYRDDHPLAGSMFLGSPDLGVTVAPTWKRGPWFSSHEHLWRYFREHGSVSNWEGGFHSNRPEAGVVAIKKRIDPGAEETFTFYISWCMPNFAKYWINWMGDAPLDNCWTWRNYYTRFFDDALDVALKYHGNSDWYHRKTKQFHDDLFGSTLPPYVIDRVASTMSIVKTPTCLMLDDGTFYGFEGCHPSSGCCEGSCTHVWGYQQALPFLFPSLERSMHDANYKYNFIWEDVGAMEFRIQVPLGSDHANLKPCADGQLGGIMHVYREWKISGDVEWLKGLWPKVKAALEFAWEEWDEAKVGVLRSFQHNTYDVDFYGPNSMLSSIYLGALRAGEEIARAVGDLDAAAEYRRIHDSGRRWVDENLFNGEYYIQQYFPGKARDNQVGDGCLIDQVFGQELALIAGLGQFLDEKQVKTALGSIFKYNWKTSMKDHENFARLYAVNDESGTVMCSWPRGGMPEVPFPYATEVMNGFEYQVATHCIMAGLLEEGLVMVKSIRDRYDGWGRNPWNEFECGHHYARSMASYGLLIALSGFEYDRGAGYLGFHPRINISDFKCFWSLGAVWGQYSQLETSATIKISHGSFTFNKIKVPILESVGTVLVKTPLCELKLECDDSGMVLLPSVVVNEGEEIALIAK
ncbi:MAG: GH116 family glycosyl-hydrolase [Promethearchaeota archaeon]